MVGEEEEEGEEEGLPSSSNSSIPSGKGKAIVWPTRVQDSDMLVSGYSPRPACGSGDSGLR